ncbi:MAG: phosphotransferase [Gaiellaceae bacterium]
MQAEEIAARVWPGRAFEIEPLGGGITNHNFKVSVDSDVFVLRIGGKDTELLGIDREVEHAAARAAADAGVGPEVTAFIEPEGYLVTRFVEGRPIPLKEMRRSEMIERVAAVLRRIHESPPIPGRFDSFRVVEVYRDTAKRYGVEVPPRFDALKRLADEIEGLRGTQPLCPCHNDLLNANFIEENGEIRIVDWEYAGMGDAFFDLANLSVNHEFGPAENQHLLEAYGRPSDLAAVVLMRFMSDFREAMWGVVQQGISQLDFDFRAYAEEHFDRLEQTAATPKFQEALRAG